MQTRSRLFDDLAKVAGGAVSTLTGLKAEIEVLIRQQIERFLVDADMVPRDEFDAVKEMAANARGGQEALEERVRDLERKLGVKAAAKTKAKTKARAVKKPARKAAAKTKTKKAKPKKRQKKDEKKSPGKGKRA